jgi:hypothetical protein
VPPRVVSTFAALETWRMLIARGCRDDNVRAPVAEAIPTRMCGGKGNRVRGQSAAENRSRSQNEEASSYLRLNCGRVGGGCSRQYRAKHGKIAEAGRSAFSQGLGVPP